jgi:hypothetical protein
MPTSSVVQEFFERYEQSRNTFDPALIDSMYPDAFMVAGPAGARVADKAVVLAGLAKGHAWLRTLGHTTTRLTSLHETSLDGSYAMVRATFVWRFEKTPAPIDVDVESTFIVHLTDGAPKIVFQHESEDFRQALRARGVLES